MTQLQQQQNGTSESAVPNGSIVGPSLAGVLNGNDLGRNEDVADSPSEAAFSVKSETSAVEEAAVAALGQLSKAKPNEGGDEARICEIYSRSFSVESGTIANQTWSR